MVLKHWMRRRLLSKMTFSKAEFAKIKHQEEDTKLDNGILLFRKEGQHNVRSQRPARHPNLKTSVSG